MLEAGLVVAVPDARGAARPCTCTASRGRARRRSRRRRVAAAGNRCASTPPVRNFRWCSASATASAAASQSGVGSACGQLDVDLRSSARPPSARAASTAAMMRRTLPARSSRSRTAASRRDQPMPLLVGQRGDAGDGACAAGQHHRDRHVGRDAGQVGVADHERADQVGVPLARAAAGTPRPRRAAGRHRAGRSRRRRPDRPRRPGTGLTRPSQPQLGRRRALDESRPARACRAGRR